MATGSTTTWPPRPSTDRLAYIQQAPQARRPPTTRSTTTASGCSRTPTATARPTRRPSSPTASTASSTAPGPACWSARDDVYYTCIPDLWRLRDKDGDGKADVRTSLHTATASAFAFRGHDLHGLIVGPDGRLYFSIGDRGLNVKTRRTARSSTPTPAPCCAATPTARPGGLRHGLRNPQELAFDEYGNLFTGDNNSDSGDQARWVYVVEGGDSGWRMDYQYLRRPRPVEPREDSGTRCTTARPAYIVPPIANIADGPSGLAYYPGTGLPERLSRTTSSCADFRGTPGQQRHPLVPHQAEGGDLRAGRLRASSLWSILATDVDFGPDGGVYVSDWVERLERPEGKGRIYKLRRSRASATPGGRRGQRLLAEGFAQRIDRRAGRDCLDMPTAASGRRRSSPWPTRTPSPALSQVAQTSG